jgi:hypothetical protein
VEIVSLCLVESWELAVIGASNRQVLTSRMNTASLSPPSDWPVQS